MSWQAVRLLPKIYFFTPSWLFIIGFRCVHRFFKHGAGSHDHESDTDSLYVQGNRLANALCLAAVPATSFLVSAAARLVKVPALLTASGILFLLIMAVLKVSGKLNELLPDDSKAGRNEEKWN